MNRNDQEFLVQKIRTQYTEKEHTQLDELKELDAKVKRPANVFAYIFGSVSAIIMGSGMSLVMTDIGATIGVEKAMVENPEWPHSNYFTPKRIIVIQMN